jgi:hypothetical protein
MNSNKWTAIVSVICITVLACYAQYRGQDGTVLIFALAAIAGLGGYKIGRTIDQIKKVQNHLGLVRPKDPPLIKILKGVLTFFKL